MEELAANLSLHIDQNGRRLQQDCNVFGEPVYEKPRMRKARTLTSVHGTMTALAESPVLCVTGIPMSMYMTSRAI